MTGRSYRSVFLLRGFTGRGWDRALSWQVRLLPCASRSGTIAHRLSTVKNEDRVYVQDEREVIEVGTYEDLQVREDGKFRKMVKVQSI